LVSLAPRRDVRCLDGYFKDIMKGPQPDCCADDYIMVTLRDVEPILDARGQLQPLYPNILHIDRPYLTTGGNLQGPAADHRRLNETELFGAFFAQMTGQELSTIQAEQFAAVLEELYREQREVKL